MRLYDLAEAYQALLLEIEESNGVLSEDLDARLDEIGDALTAKADACAAMVRTLEAEAAAFKEEADRFGAKRKAAEAGAARLKTYLKSCLELAGERKVKGARFTVAIQANAPSVELEETDPEALPPEFVRVKKEVDKTAIKTALQAGEPLAFARLVQTESVRIR